MLENTYMVGIVTKDRYDGLITLINSLRFNSAYTIIVDASDKVLDLGNICNVKFYNIPKKQVVYNKNTLINLFLNYSDFEYLFIIEDDIKILDDSVFDEYITASRRHSMPHMNFCSKYDGNMVYNLNKEIKVSERLQGAFQFFTRNCLKRVGPMNEKLNGNCWEHIEHTARIHKEFNYYPVFWHFPDITNSDEMIRYQKIPSSIGKISKETKDHYKNIMLQSLGWKGLPLVDIKRLNIL